MSALFFLVTRVSLGVGRGPRFVAGMQQALYSTASLENFLSNLLSVIQHARRGTDAPSDNVPCGAIDSHTTLVHNFHLFPQPIRSDRNLLISYVYPHFPDELPDFGMEFAPTL